MISMSQCAAKVVAASSRFKKTKSITAAVLLAVTGGALNGLAQSDNFDSGTLDPAWKQANFNPGLVQTSFPAVGTGKGFRIRANPVPGQAPAAALFYRDDVYTDFYVAVDIANWPGTDLDQAMVLFGRANLTPNLLTSRGVICNYDASQEGQDATSRRQGQFQINLVTDDPPFGTKTIAATEITLIPGRSYRMVFTGVGSLYTAKIYDHEDLTKPLVTIHADDVIQGPGGNLSFDVPFTTGKCGFLSFSREGNTGVTDVTIDNYFAAAADPNPATPPALAHPIPGTPTIETRNPAERFRNFWNPADSITFTAKTYTPDVIDAAATKFRLNGQDVSSRLTMSANGTTVNGTLPGSALAANTVYSASIEVQDVSGAKKSTNTFFFDTFSDAYLRSAAVKTIEAEDFNYESGQHLAEPIPVSGFNTNNGETVNLGLGYLELGGVEGIDFHDARTTAEGAWFAEYRSGTPVGLGAGMFPEIEDLNESELVPVRRSDNVRSQFASSNLLEVVVHRTQPGEWLNYTRDFTAGSYTLYLRVATFGATTVELHKVTSDPTQPDQTTQKLGQFNVPNTIQRYNYVYVPLVNDAGQPVTLDLSGTTTLRLLMAGTTGQDDQKLAINYMLFAPAASGAVTVYSSATVDGVFTADATATVDTSAKTITIPVGTGNRFYRVSGNVTLSNTRLAGANLVFNYQ
jgi:hypothetical protein